MYCCFLCSEIQFQFQATKRCLGLALFWFMERTSLIKACGLAHKSAGNSSFQSCMVPYPCLVCMSSFCCASVSVWQAVSPSVNLALHALFKAFLESFCHFGILMVLCWSWKLGAVKWEKAWPVPFRGWPGQLTEFSVLVATEKSHAISRMGEGTMGIQSRSLPQSSQQFSTGIDKRRG